jgi:hypothetical protein
VQAQSVEELVRGAAEHVARCQADGSVFFLLFFFFFLCEPLLLTRQMQMIKSKPRIDFLLLLFFFI